VARRSFAFVSHTSLTLRGLGDADVDEEDRAHDAAKLGAHHLEAMLSWRSWFAETRARERLKKGQRG